MELEDRVRKVLSKDFAGQTLEDATVTVTESLQKDDIVNDSDYVDEEVFAEYVWDTAIRYGF